MKAIFDRCGVGGQLFLRGASVSLRQDSLTTSPYPPCKSLGRTIVQIGARHFRVNYNENQQRYASLTVQNLMCYCFVDLGQMF
ncbi:uncharacterized protein LOC143177745 isoform X5 [Calliopsis andreniformis]